jgi:anti-anti-sigma factor
LALTTQTRIIEGVAVVHCQGTIVFGEETTELHLYLKDLLDEQHSLVLDLSGVPYLDSSGMGMLIGVYVSAVRDGRQLKLAGLTAKVRRVLTTTRLLKLFEVYDDEASAMQACLRAR